MSNCLFNLPIRIPIPAVLPAGPVSGFWLAPANQKKPNPFPLMCVLAYGLLASSNRCFARYAVNGG